MDAVPDTPHLRRRPGFWERQRLTVLSVWTWLVVAVLATVCVALQVVAVPVTWPFDRRRLVTGRLLRLVAVGTARLTPLWRFEVSPPLPPRRPGRTVVVSNHCSSSDPFAIAHLPWEMKWLGKSSMFRIPIVGWAMRLAGDVPVLRGDRRSSDTALARCARWLERGVPVMIFPEGTRSRDGGLGPFKDGAFRLAITTGADILPIAVAGTTRALRKHSWRLGRARARVAVGSFISTLGMTLDDLARLKDAARVQIEALAQRLARELA